MISRTIACAVVLICPLFALGNAQATTLTAIRGELSGMPLANTLAAYLKDTDGSEITKRSDQETSASHQDLRDRAERYASSAQTDRVQDALQPRNAAGHLSDLFDSNLSDVGAGFESAVFKNGTLITFANTPFLIKHFWGRISDSPFAEIALEKWSERGLPTFKEVNRFIHKRAPTPSAVPLPASVWLFVSGLLGLIAITRSKAGAVAANSDLSAPDLAGA